MSSNGFQTNVWGTPAWVFLHCISYNYPLEPTQKQKREYMRFFRDIKNVLPCKYCRACYGKMIASGPLRLSDRTMRSRASLSRWLFNVHRAINIRVSGRAGKSYEEVTRMYELFRAKCGDANAKGCVVPARGARKKARVCVRPLDKHTGQSLVVREKCSQ